MSTPASSSTVEDVEIQLLVEGVFRLSGYDFRDYAPGSLRRRIRDRLRAEHVRTISALQEKALHDPACMERLVLGLSVTVSSMFRDPGFYLAFRTRAVPLLRTYPFIRIWHAGCSTGEEVYSMAILLHEEGIYERCRIYATDMNESALRQAKIGSFRPTSLKEYTDNYERAGGKGSLADFYTMSQNHAIFRASLKDNLIFAHHNLATDGPFNEFQAIICRNVIIYFNKSLQTRVHGMLLESLVRFGFLGLGSKESLKYTPYESYYEELDPQQKLYRRIK